MGPMVTQDFSVQTTYGHTRALLWLLTTLLYYTLPNCFFLSTWGMLSVVGFLPSSPQSHECPASPLQWAACHIKGTHTPC